MKVNLFVSIVSLFWFYFLLVGISSEDNFHKTDRKSRIKRRVLFPPKAVWFMRMNGKSNMLNYTTIFSQGWGFKITYELPTTESKRVGFFKRDVNIDIDDFIAEKDKQYFGYIMDQICQRFLVKRYRKCGISCKIQNIVNRSNGSDSDFFRLLFQKCDYYSRTLLGI